MSSRDQHIAASGRQVTPRGASICVAWRGVQKKGKRGCRRPCASTASEELFDMDEMEARSRLSPKGNCSR